MFICTISELSMEPSSELSRTLECAHIWWRLSGVCEDKFEVTLDQQLPALWETFIPIDTSSRGSVREPGELHSADGLVHTCLDDRLSA